MKKDQCFLSIEIRWISFFRVSSFIWGLIFLSQFFYCDCFVESCQETCAGSHKIVTKAFVSVLKQNLILQSKLTAVSHHHQFWFKKSRFQQYISSCLLTDELNTLRSSISELKGDKEKLDAATQRCRGKHIVKIRKFLAFVIEWQLRWATVIDICLF